MKWQLTEPKYGDIIRVKAGEIYHYGVFINDNEIVQFGLSPALRKNLQEDDVEVCLSDVDTFLCGGFLEVCVLEKKDKKRFPPKKTVKIALSRLGERGYNILYNNCEHFAFECFLGEKYCSQTESVRDFFKMMTVADVYVAKKHNVLSFDGLFPTKRQNEIDEVSNLEVKKDKYLVWKLLEYALKQSFGVDIKDVKFTKDETGKWRCDKCEFSLSHSKNVVCVAVSKNPIGVDVEKINSDRFEFLEKILSDKEKEEYQKIKPKERAEFLFNAWTKKESLFKRRNIKEISIKEFSLLDEKVYQEKLDFCDGEYSLSVATKFIEKVKVYKNVNY